MAERIVFEKFTESKDFLSPIQYNLLKTLDNIGPSTRKDLVKHLNTPRTTIYDNLVKLQKRRLIEKFSRTDGKRGRPLVFWKIKP
ncbi:MAG: MarR family transcriptional regulator [Promethearchaeota archaeon]